MQSIDKKFIAACKVGDVRGVIRCLKDPKIKVSTHAYMGLRFACRDGHTKIVEILLDDERSNPGANENHPLRFACFNGHTDNVSLLCRKYYALLNKLLQHKLLQILVSKIFSILQ